MARTRKPAVKAAPKTEAATVAPAETVKPKEPTFANEGFEATPGALAEKVFDPGSTLGARPTGSGVHDPGSTLDS